MLTSRSPHRENAVARDVLEDDYESKYIFVEFNAWLYQGYDDARAALLDAIASELVRVADERETAGDKAREFLSRVDWFRVAGLTAGSVAALAFGLPPVGTLGQVFSMAKRLVKGEVDEELIEDGEKVAGHAVDQAKGVLKDKDDPLNPRQQIVLLRKSFEEALAELDVTLVVLIDDLDRCLPETAVSTLEAIRLFLFLEGTAFVIAADDKMIKHAVRKHFGEPDDDLVTNYFDKLIQIPIRVPTLGTQEVRAYMFLLYVESSSLATLDKETVRSAVCNQLQHVAEVLVVRRVRRRVRAGVPAPEQARHRVATGVTFEYRQRPAAFTSERHDRGSFQNQHIVRGTGPHDPGGTIATYRPISMCCPVTHSRPS